MVNKHFATAMFSPVPTLMMFQVLHKEDNWTETALQHLRNKFSPEKSETKIKEDVFDGPEIWDLMLDTERKRKLKPTESE